MSDRPYVKVINLLSHINLLMNHQVVLRSLPYMSEHLKKIYNQNHRKIYINLKKLINNDYFNSFTNDRYSKIPYKHICSIINQKIIIHWLQKVLIKNIHTNKKDTLENLRTKIYQAKALVESQPNFISNGERTYLMQITNDLYYLNHRYWHIYMHPDYTSYTTSPLLCDYIPELDSQEFSKATRKQIHHNQSQNIIKHLDDILSSLKSLKTPVEKFKYDIFKGLSFAQQSPDWALTSNFLQDLRLYMSVIPKLKKSERPLSKDSLLADVNNIEVMYQARDQEYAIPLLDEIYPQIRLIAKSKDHENDKAKQKIFSIINKLLDKGLKG